MEKKEIGLAVVGGGVVGRIRAMLARDFPDDPMQVPHRVVAAWGRKP